MMERARRMAFAAAVTVALGFGAQQALAQPDRARDDARACNDSLCARVCHAAGFPGGFCNSAGGCSCYL
ncbi:MAG: hypothetical protein JWM27_2095 [Gemmatimonadetes bacterium]|nr:hypothetical protein [Gemmatimonadota bacterium]